MFSVVLRRNDMDFQKVHYSVDASVAMIVMDNPKNLNAIDEQTGDDLTGVIDKEEKDPEAKVIVLKSAARAFSAGDDIGWFYKLIQEGGKIDLGPVLARVGRIVNMLKSSSKIVIAEVNGAAAGAG